MRHDSRGIFLELFTLPSFMAHTGRSLCINQMNVSTSRRNVVRGIHGSRAEPGQAKYVTCVAGRVLDVVVDLRIDSPNFGEWDAVELDEPSHRAIFIPEGHGHAFQVLTESATLVYASSSLYSTHAEFTISPLDAELGLPWADAASVIMSQRDREAMSLADFRAESDLENLQGDFQ